MGSREQYCQNTSLCQGKGEGLRRALIQRSYSGWYLRSSWMMDCRDGNHQVTETTHSQRLSMWIVFLPVAQIRPRSNKALDLHQATQSPVTFFFFFFFKFQSGPVFLGSAPTQQALQLSQVLSIPSRHSPAHPSR